MSRLRIRGWLFPEEVPHDYAGPCLVVLLDGVVRDAHRALAGYYLFGLRLPNDYITYVKPTKGEPR